MSNSQSQGYVTSMGHTKRSFAKFLPLAALIFSVLTGLALGLTHSQQMSALTSQQKSHLGNILAGQLAKVIREPLIHRDSLSLQVELDDMLAITGVRQAAVYDIENQLIARAGDNVRRSMDISRYRTPVSVDNSTIGFVSVILQPDYYAAQTTTATRILLLLWALLAAILVFVAFRFGSSLSTRLTILIEQLPGSETREGDELTQLECRIDPLLRKPGTASDPLFEQSVTTVAIACRNLPRLEALLNQEHFKTLMVKLDQLVEGAERLYGATRLPGSDYHIYLEFAEGENDQLPRAIHCAAALLRLSSQLLDKQGIAVELSAAVSPGRQQTSPSILLSERELGKRLAGMKSLLDKAATGEILLAEHAHLEQVALDDIDLSPLAEGSAVYRINHFGEHSEARLKRQLVILGEQLDSL